MCVRNVQKLAEAGSLRTREMQYVPDYLSIAGNELMAYEIGAGGMGVTGIVPNNAVANGTGITGMDVNNAAANSTIVNSIRTTFGRGHERLSQKTAAGKTFFHPDIG